MCVTRWLPVTDIGLSFKPGSPQAGINAHELRCFDSEGEWANFRGFDMMAVSVSGYVDVEGAVDAPMVPVQVIVANTELPIAHTDSLFGEISYLPSMIEMPDIKPHFLRGPQPLGSSPLAW